MSTIRKSTKSAAVVESTPVAVPGTPTAPVAADVLIAAPPALSAMLAPPEGFVPTDATAYRGVMPTTAQLAVMPGVVKELLRFTDYLIVFGKTAPPLAIVLQTFSAAMQWSQMRAKTDAWDVFCHAQEGMSWRDVHLLMEKLQPAFELAASADASVTADNPMLARLFGAAKLAARKGVVTKKANAKAKAEGKLPVSGKVGKARKKTAANAALEAASAQQDASTATAAARSTQSSAPTTGDTAAAATSPATTTTAPHAAE